MSEYQVDKTALKRFEDGKEELRAMNPKDRLAFYLNDSQILSAIAKTTKDIASTLSNLDIPQSMSEREHKELFEGLRMVCGGIIDLNIWFTKTIPSQSKEEAAMIKAVEKQFKNKEDMTVA